MAISSQESLGDWQLQSGLRPKRGANLHGDVLQKHPSNGAWLATARAVLTASESCVHARFPHPLLVSQAVEREAYVAEKLAWLAEGGARMLNGQPITEWLEMVRQHNLLETVLQKREPLSLKQRDFMMGLVSQH